MEFPAISKDWFFNSNYLVYLSVDDEAKLQSLAEKAISKNIKVSIFREPDLDNQVTAVAFEPSDVSRRLCSNLPLALKKFNQIKEVVYE